MLSILNKPVFQILIFGITLSLILFIVFGLKSPTEEDRQVIIGDADLAQIIASWERTWKRLPTKEELNGLLENHVKEEILYREALNQNMDKNNAMIKRGLVVQMNMLAESQAQEKNITKEAIKAYYDLRKDRYMSEPRYSFTQIYFDRSQPIAELEKIRENLNTNNTSPNSKELPGIKGMLPSTFEMARFSEVKRALGEDFSVQLEEIQPNNWAGPVTSGFGLHLIYISEKHAPEPLPLEAVRDEILNDLSYEEATAAKELFYTEIRQQYDVVYEGIAKDLVNE